MSEGPDLVELAKRRGFFFPATDAYGGVAGFYTYGPEGAGLKHNIESVWRDRFVTREGHMEIETPDIMPEAVFEASGHLDVFDDMIVECPDCNRSHRADHLVEDATDIEDAESMDPQAVADRIAASDVCCPACGVSLAGERVDEFNLMFGTNIGPGSSSPGFLRPETAQGIFVEFPRLAEYARNQLPFGVAQIGKAYRNEISPRRSLIRVREFTQAEIEYFIDPEADEPPLDRVAGVDLPLYPAVAQAGEEEASLRTVSVEEAVDDGVVEEWVAFYLGLAAIWYDRIGIDMDRFRYRQHRSGELSHYASDCWDAEVEIDGNWIEITGFAYRGSYDLDRHAEFSQAEFTVFKQYDEPRTIERATVAPDMSVLGPKFGDEAEAIADELEKLAARDRDAFLSARDGTDSAHDSDGREPDGSPGDSATVTVDVEGNQYAVPVEATGFTVEEITESGRQITPHVVEPSFGVGRLVYSVLDHNLHRDEVDGEPRTYLALPPELAPTTVAVLPLMAKDGLSDRARVLAADLRTTGMAVDYDTSGNIGRRYRRQDEVGTPYCVTVDYDTLEDDTVTVRDRDSTTQVRLPTDGLAGRLEALVSGETSFDGLREARGAVDGR